MSALAISAFIFAATRGLVAWLGQWHSRGNRALLRDLFDDEPSLNIRDVLPWPPQGYMRSGYLEFIHATAFVVDAP